MAAVLSDGSTPVPAATRRKPPRRLVPLIAASEYAQLSVRTLRRRVQDGTVTGYRAGPRLIMIDLDEIDTVLIRPIPAAPRGDAA
jgi:hypothetical protein